MAKKARKKLDPKNFTQKEHDKAYVEAIASGEVAPGEHLPELKPKKDGEFPQPKAPKVK